MKYFEYSEPASLDEASALLQQSSGQASLMAGGTDLMVQMKEHVRSPSRVINIKKIPGLDDFEYSPERGLRIGALITTREIETSEIAQRHYASLARASTDFASIQVRNRATVVGNVCRASPSADTLPALIADDAVLQIFGSAGRRSCKVEDFFQGPGRTKLGSEEIVTHIEIPAPAARTGKAYIKHGRRSQMELATVGVAVRITLDSSGKVSDVAVVLAAVAPGPLRSHQAEAALKNQLPTNALIAEAGRAAASDSKPISDVRASADYRREMVRVLTERALHQAIQEAKQ